MTTDRATENRERMRQWSPEFFALVMQLKELGMFGRVVVLDVPRKDEPCALK